MSKNNLHVLFDDDDILLEAIKKIREKKYYINEVYTPFPVHGLDKALGLAPTRIAIAAFIYGCIGFTVAILMMNYIMIVDWPQNIGGKPSFSFIENMPSFVPIMFEMTVFFAAHLMVLTFYMKSKLWPFKKAENPNPLTTDNMFLIDMESGDDLNKLKVFLKKTGAVSIEVIMVSLLFTSCFATSRPNFQYFPDMYESLAGEAYAESDAFSNGIEAQLPVQGSIPRGWEPYEYEDTNEGYELAKLELLSPLVTNEYNVSRGKELYQIYCSGCHGDKGDGLGILAEREKFLGIPAYNDPSRIITEGSIYHVLMYGKNAMGSHSGQVNEEERWQIIQYVLQLKEELEQD